MITVSAFKITNVTDPPWDSHVDKCAHEHGTFFAITSPDVIGTDAVKDCVKSVLTCTCNMYDEVFTQETKN